MLSKEISINNFKNAVKQDLKLVDEVIKSRLHNKSDLIKDITYHIINSGGKRLRPALTILSAQLFNHKGNNRHINLAAAVEFIHTATLLHDDVVDHSTLRRGLPTANRNWGNKESILVGDFLLSQAFLLMSEDNDLEIIRILSTASAIIVEGEVNQLSSISNLSLTIDGYLKIIIAKTAELFAASCMVGAAIAVPDKLFKDTMYDFGLNLGIVFQIIDDILDYTANTNTLGKNIGDDFREGKATLPVIIAYNNSNVEEREFWQRTIIEKNQEPNDLEKALLIMQKYDVIEICKKYAFEFFEIAKRKIDLVPEGKIKNQLIELLEFSINREF